MPKKAKVKTTPLSFEIDAELASGLDRLRKEVGGVSFSKLIDYAIESFDYSKVARKAGGKRRQLSVRLSDTKRGSLDKLSRSEKVSMAYLIRMALEAMMASASKKTVQAAIKSALATEAPVKKAAKKPAKKAAKKPAKKAAKKPVKPVKPSKKQ
jgi:predicted transcriptional regulator